MTEESLFAAALEKPAGAERRAFLDEACAGDARLRRRLEQLLDPLAQPAVAPARGVEERLPVGPGRLLQGGGEQ